MRKRSNIRLANGAVSAVIVCLFLFHGLLGGCALFFSSIGSLAWAIWIGVGVVAIHMVLSIATSYEQMTDKQFPPSARKKRHLVLKWVTGGVLAIAAGVHIACMMAGLSTSLTSSFVMVVVAAVLAVHVCVGAKSLLTDLGQNKDLMVPLRIVVCIAAAVIACLVIAGCIW